MSLLLLLMNRRGRGVARPLHIYYTLTPTSGQVAVRECDSVCKLVFAIYKVLSTMRRNEQFHFSMKYGRNAFECVSRFCGSQLNGLSFCVASQIIMRVQSAMKWCLVIYCSNLFRIKWKLINYACLLCGERQCGGMRVWAPPSATHIPHPHEYVQGIEMTPKWMGHAACGWP